jgi:manganese transport protein
VTPSDTRVTAEPAALEGARRVRPAAPGRARLLATLGPAFVAAIAYVDPGNFATNFTGGVRYGYQLLWCIAAASIAATAVQYATSKVGLATGQSLPQLCRARFSAGVNWTLWVQAEVVAMATDLAEFVGAAVGLHLVFGIPLLAAGVATAACVFLVLALERYRRGCFVAAIAAMFFAVVAGFAYLFCSAGTQRYAELARGLLPHAAGRGQLTLVVGIVGATVMPHVIYAHSALQAHHPADADAGERLRRLRLNRWDCIVGLGFAGLANVAMLCVAAALPRAANASTGDLTMVYTDLGRVGGGCAAAFGIALIASGLASSAVGTYAGQVVMSGFVRRRIPVVARRAVTMIPSLVVLALAVNTTDVLVLSQVILSFCIPFALVPLLLVSRDRGVMRDLANRQVTTIMLALISTVIIALNASLLYTALT